MSIPDVGKPRPGADDYRAPGLLLEIVEQDGDWSAIADRRGSIEAAGAALAAHPRCRQARSSEASIVLASDDFVKALNNAYRGKNSATNVLSFPFQVPPGGESARYLGDVVLACETLQREAAEQGISSKHHLQHLVIHGLLHLLGFDHVAPAEAEDMESLEAQLLDALGVADPYARDPLVEAQ
ncbi:MAG TPA: rRNA maturation RNase YbeY [Hyphomicrobiaceae bacterium]|jgi:probable rRNA maturation factor|nr:rRNA maturation RNase YbeY [Hyphomicrobiaceae bacterium]